MAKQKSEELYRELVEGTSDLVTRVDGDGRFVYVNQAAKAILGVNPEVCVGLSAFDFVHPEDRKKTREWFDDCVLRQVTSATIENRQVSRAGEVFHMLWRSNFSFDDSGAVIEVDSITRDITERRRMEKSLRESEARFRAIFEQAAVGVAHIETKTGKFLRTNEAFCRIVGYKQEEMTATTFMKITHPDDLEHDLENMRKLMAGEIREFSMEKRYLQKDGSVVWGNLTVSPMWSVGEEPDCHIAVVEDITDRKRMERVLQEAFEEMETKVKERTVELTNTNEELQAIYDGMVDGLLVADSETRRFVRVNHSICQMLGYSKEELLAMSVNDIHPHDYLPRVVEKFKAQAEGRIALAEDIPVMRKDGTVFFADIASNPVTYQERACAIGFFRDITERRMAQERIQREQRTLRRLVESSDRDRKLTAYEIHDGFTQHIVSAKMQLESASQLMNENPEAAAEACQRSVELLTFGIGEARRLISGLRPPILDEAGVVAAIEHLIDDPGRQEGPEVSLIFKATFGRLESLLENAIFRVVQESVTNARRYSQSKKAEVRLTQRDSLICIEVEDWGVGFHPEDISSSTFGISGIKERARLLGGQATIDSTPGKGTLVRVELPLVEDG